MGSKNLKFVLSMTFAILVVSSVKALVQTMKVRAVVKSEVISLAKLLPGHEAVVAMYGTGEIAAAQFMAELGDVRQRA